MQYIVPLKIACALLILILVSAAVQNRFDKKPRFDKKQENPSNNGVPIVARV